MEQLKMNERVSKPGQTDRRAKRISRRASVRLALKVRGEDFVYNVNTVNFSKTGLRVQTRMPLEPGQPVVALPNKSGTPTGYCRVVWMDGREAGLQLVH
jgi:hypothetical protein